MYYKSQAFNSRAALLVVCSQPTWLWANTFVKVSVACMLLRIKQNATWKWFLYGAMAVQVASATGTTVTLFTECKPFQTLWDPTIPGGYCSLNQIKESMYVNLCKFPRCSLYNVTTVIDTQQRSTSPKTSSSRCSPSPSSA